MFKTRRLEKRNDAAIMHMNGKRRLLLLLIGSMAFIVSFVVICAAIYPSGSYGPEFPANTDCSFTSHAFAHIGIGLSVLFILSLLGSFLIINRSIILDGFYMSPFKPPRFHA